MKALIHQGTATNWESNTPHLPPGILATATLEHNQKPSFNPEAPGFTGTRL